MFVVFFFLSLCNKKIYDAHAIAYNNNIKKKYTRTWKLNNANEYICGWNEAKHQPATTIMNENRKRKNKKTIITQQE